MEGSNEGSMAQDDSYTFLDRNCVAKLLRSSSHHSTQFPTFSLSNLRPPNTTISPCTVASRRSILRLAAVHTPRNRNFLRARSKQAGVRRAAMRGRQMIVGLFCHFEIALLLFCCPGPGNILLRPAAPPGAYVIKERARRAADLLGCSNIADADIVFRVRVSGHIFSH